MSALPHWGVEGAENSFEARRESRTAEIQRKLLDLEDRRLVNRALVGKALKVIRLPVEGLDSVYRGLDNLLEKLRRGEMSVGDFTERWYQLDQDSVHVPPGRQASAAAADTARAETSTPPLTLLPTPGAEAPSPAAAPPSVAPADRAALGERPRPARGAWWLGTRAGLVAVLAAVFLTNYLQTGTEEWIKRDWEDSGPGAWLLSLGEAFTGASYELEGGLSFGAHDATRPSTVYGYSAAYFIVFPLICLAVAAALYRRPQISPFRVLTLSVAVDYAISLPFFLFFPVVERWTWAESDAILLSDLWCSSLIDAMRPISGLDNCFPSFHCSLSVILILLSYVYRLRGRAAVLGLGLIIILSTFVLGIHWLPDMAAGVAVAALAVAVARKMDGRLASADVEEPAPQPAESGGPQPRAPWIAIMAQRLWRRDAAPGVFVSYRRQDSRHIAARIGDHLAQRYGADRVAIDVADIAPGDDWRHWIRGAVERSDVLFAIIGPGWLRAEDEAGNRRLDSAEDWVRFEIEAAFEQGVRVVPLLVDDAELPAAAELPPSLRPLTDRQAVSIGNDARFQGDMQQLIAALDEARRKAARRAA